MFVVDFEPVGRRGECSGDKSLLACARGMNVDIVSICGDAGTCRRCKIQIISGEVSPLTVLEKSALSARELQKDYRLACRTYPRSNVKVHVPPESLTAPQRTQVEGLELTTQPEPAVTGFDLRLEAPSLSSPESDDGNLCNTLERQHGVSRGTVDLMVQRTLSQRLRELNWQVRVAVRENEIVAVGAPATRWIGMAVDIGTTKIAVYLVDLQTGRTLASKGLMNPQIAYGEDVVARITAAGKAPENAVKLQMVLIEALNQAAAALCIEIKSDASSIVDAVLVGNTAIHHLFLGLPVRQLGVSPYVPAVKAAVDMKARDLGLAIAPGAYVHLLPNVAGYVGADHVAMVLATGIIESRKITLAVDIGTNTEMCLNSKGRLTSVSCASGPAFEGAHIKFGMRAAPGAIEHLRLSGTKLAIQTIGGAPPVGLCGSGLLDVAAQLRLNDVLDRSGRMQDHPLVRRSNGSAEFVLVERPGREDITVSQKDIRELQLAKSAIRLGIRALVESEGLTEDDIEEVIIAGAFGTFIDVESAITIGMLPPLPLERFRQVGNAAGTGARLALISRSQRLLARTIADLDGYIELACIPGFNRKFAEASYMPGQPEPRTARHLRAR